MFIPHPVGFFSGGLTSITQVGSATSTGETIVAPADIRPGDLIVLADFAVNNSTAANAGVLPSGFTEIGSTLLIAAGTNGMHLYTSYKRANGTEDSAVLTGILGGSTSAKALYLFRGDLAALTVTVGGFTGQASNGDITLQTVTASTAVAPLIVFGVYANYIAAVDPRTMSPAKDAEVNPNTRLYLAYKIFNDSPVNVSVDMDDEGDGNAVQSFYIQMAS